MQFHRFLHCVVFFMFKFCCALANAKALFCLTIFTEGVPLSSARVGICMMSSAPTVLLRCGVKACVPNCTSSFQ